MNHVCSLYKNLENTNKHQKMKIISNQPTRITWLYNKCCLKPCNSSVSVPWLIGQLSSSLSEPINFNTDTGSYGRIDNTHPQCNLFPASMLFLPSSKNQLAGFQNQLLAITLLFTLHNKTHAVHTAAPKKICRSCKAENPK